MIVVYESFLCCAPAASWPAVTLDDEGEERGRVVDDIRVSSLFFKVSITSAHFVLLNLNFLFFPFFFLLD